MKDNCQDNDRRCLKTSVLHRIESEGVCPRSRMFFHSRECFVWFFWFISIVIGALAVAVSLFVMLHSQYALYEATHSNFLTFIVSALPYLWIIAFAIMIGVAVYNLRHTKHGYRWPLWKIIASSIVLSFAAGSALQLFGLGYATDKYLGAHMPMYKSQEKMEYGMWQNPREGRLVGRQVYTTLQPTTTIIFADVEGRHWTLDVTELTEKDHAALASTKKVKLLGLTTDPVIGHFHACGAFPWMYEGKISADAMRAQRQAFVDRVYEHVKMAEKRPQPPKELSYPEAAASNTAGCATMKVVSRMPKESAQ